MGCGGSHQTLGAGNTAKCARSTIRCRRPSHQGMIGHHLARMPDMTRPANTRLNTLADQAPGHRVAVGIEVDGAIRLNLANQIPQLSEGCPSDSGRSALASSAKRSAG